MGSAAMTTSERLIASAPVQPPALSPALTSVGNSESYSSLESSDRFEQPNSDTGAPGAAETTSPVSEVLDPVRDPLYEACKSSLVGLELGMLGKLFAVIASYRLTGDQYWILMLLSESQEGLSMGEIAQLLGQSTGTTTATMDGLEGLGLAKRHLTKNDRRKVFARITTRGIDFLKTTLSFEPRQIEAIMEKLSDVELRAWIEGSRKMEPALLASAPFQAMSVASPQKRPVQVPA
jgi:DNA-binding MarR family transcriptional regulator